MPHNAHIIQFASHKKQAPPKRPDLLLHPKITETLFEHYAENIIKFRNVIGLLYIDYLSVNIIDPDNILSIFSSNPTLEFNLIEENLMQFESTYSVMPEKRKSFYFWDEAYRPSQEEKLKKIKQSDFSYKLGFCLSKNTCQNGKTFNLTYSFATSSALPEEKKYFEKNKAKYEHLGDYMYKLIRELYVNYSHYEPPLIDNLKRLIPPEHEKNIIYLNKKSGGRNYQND